MACSMVLTLPITRTILDESYSTGNKITEYMMYCCSFYEKQWDGLSILELTAASCKRQSLMYGHKRIWIRLAVPLA